MTIRILDINDQTPTFNLAQYQATVPENTQSRIPVSILPIGTEMIVSDWDEVRQNDGYFFCILPDNLA